MNLSLMKIERVNELKRGSNVIKNLLTENKIPSVY